MSISVASLSIGLAADGSVAELAIKRDGEVLSNVVLDPLQLSELIETLAVARASMPEPVSPTLDAGARLVPILQPGWTVQQVVTDQNISGTLIALRHPGFGWTGYLLDAERAQEIGRALLDWSRPVSS